MAASKPVEAAMAAAAAPGSGNGVGGGSGTAGPGSGAGTLPRWHVALAIGAPLLLGAGAMYLWSRRRRRREAAGRGESSGLKRNSERKTPEGRASPALGSGHPDGSGDSLEMVRSCPGRRGGNERIQLIPSPVVRVRGPPTVRKLPCDRKDLRVVSGCFL